MTERSFSAAVSWLIILICPVVAATPSEADLAISHVRVITGTGEVLSDAEVVVSRGRILSVGRAAAETSARLKIDGRGKTLLPGLIDAHVHILLGRAVTDQESLAHLIREELPATMDGFLSHGVTTIRSVGDHWPQVLEVRRRLAEGEIQGPRLLIAGPVLTAPGGHPAATVCRDNAFCRVHLAAEISTEEEALQIVQELGDGRINVIKLVVDDFARFERSVLPQLSFDLVRVVIEEAHRRGIQVVGHIVEASTASQALKLGLDGLVHPPVVGEEDFDRLLSVLRERPVSVVSTLTLGGTRGQRRKDVVKAFSEAGVPIVVGTDYVVRGPARSREWGAGGRTIREMELLVEAGLSPQAAIRAATRDAADHLGILDQTGTVEVGKTADLILVDGDPLADISALWKTELVLKAGQIVADKRQRPRGETLERPNWRESSLRVGGLTRWYRVYVPGLLPQKAPVVVLLHGGRQSMRRIFSSGAVATREWADVGEAERFLLVVPNGTNTTNGDTRGDRQGWNDGRITDFPADPEVDDVTFISELLDRIEQTYSIDQTRIYVTGASNGGMMTFRLLMEAPGRFAAGVAFIANLPVDGPAIREPSLPTPLMIANGTRDPVIKWDGGEILKGHGFVRSAEATVAWWVEANRARPESPVSEYLPDIDPTDPCRVRRTTYPAMENGAPVVFYALEGGGHVMPSRKHEIPDDFPNRPVCRDVEGARLAWDFMKHHSRDP